MSIEPIRKSVSVARGVDEAFKLFTEGLGTWWPFNVGHSIGEERVATAVFEPKEGGRVYEVWDDGTEHHWAEVLVYDPPHRFVLAWKPNPERPAPTELEVRFRAEGTGTRLDLEHRGWERLGDPGVEARGNYDSGWPRTLELYAEAAS
jgi:uncharacterized protein YndB with AHSA1/START domain